MKKLKLLLLTVLITSISTYAQDASWGPMVGVNGSTLSGNLPLNAYKPGLNLGLFYNWSNNERLGIKVEGLYSQMGTAYESGYQQTIDMHYIQIPVYGVWYLNDRGNDFRPKLMFGPYVGFLAGANGSDTQNTYFTKDIFTKVDVGAKGALGFNWNLNDNLWLNTELYYGAGFADVYKSNTLDIKNQQVGLNVGLSFPIK